MEGRKVGLRKWRIFQLPWQEQEIIDNVTLKNTERKQLWHHNLKAGGAKPVLNSNEMDIIPLSRKFAVQYCKFRMVQLCRPYMQASHCNATFQ